MKEPIEMMLDGVHWVPTVEDRPSGPDNSEGIPYATHEGVLDLAGQKMRCYRLSNGQTVFDADDFKAFFEELSGAAAPDKQEKP